MKNSVHLISLPCIALYALLLAATGCKNDTSKKEQAGSSAAVVADTLQAFVLKKQPVSRKLELPAELLPLEKAEIFGKVPGYVRQIKVDIGDKVWKGQLLVLIDAPEMTAQLNQAQTKLAEIQAKYSNSFEQYQRLYKAAQIPGTISGAELSQAYHLMQTDSAAVQTAKASIDTYSQLNNYLAITSPFSGIATQRQADVGSFVGANPAKPLLVIENNSRLRLRVGIPEVYAASKAKNREIKFSTPAEPTKTYQAFFSRQSGSIDPGTRTETWEYLFDNTASALKPGMYVKTVVDIERSEASFAVPHSAIVSNLEKKYVIAQRGGKAVHIPVRTGFKMQDQTEIFGALQEGDTLLLKPNDEIRLEQPLSVKIIEAPENKN